MKNVSMQALIEQKVLIEGAWRFTSYRSFVKAIGHLYDVRRMNSKLVEAGALNVEALSAKNKALLSKLVIILVIIKAIASIASK